MHYSIFNTNGYMKLVGPVGKDPEAIRALSDYIAGQVVTPPTCSSARRRRCREGPVPRRAHHRRRQPVHRRRHRQGPVHAAGVRLVAQDQHRRARQDRRPPTRRDHHRLHPRRRRQARHTPAHQPGARLGGRQASGRLGREVLAPGHRPRTPTDQATQQVPAWLGRPLPADFGQITLLQNDSLGAGLSRPFACSTRSSGSSSP